METLGYIFLGLLAVAGIGAIGIGIWAYYALKDSMGLI